MDKITELPNINYSNDEQASLVVQNVAIIGRSEAMEFIKSMGAMTGAGMIGYVPGEWIVKKCDMGEWPDDVVMSHAAGGWFQNYIRDTDRPGIAAMATKNAAPDPEPVLSIRGEQVSEREIAEVLREYRAKHVLAVKETPQGLMTVRAFDHRLGLWSGEGC